MNIWAGNPSYFNEWGENWLRNSGHTYNENDLPWDVIKKLYPDTWTQIAERANEDYIHRWSEDR